MKNPVKKSITGVLTAVLLAGILSFFLPVLGEEVNEGEQFPISRTGTDYYLKNAYSGLYLDAGDATLNTRPVQKPFSGEASQRFSLGSELTTGELRNGPYMLISRKDSTLLLSIENVRTANGTAVRLFTWPPGNKHAQFFQILKNENGTWRLQRNRSETRQVLEIAGPSKRENAPAQTWSYVGAENQQWILEPVEPIVLWINELALTGGSTSLTLGIVNNSNTVFSYGEEFLLEKYADENVKPLDALSVLDENKWAQYAPKKLAYWDLAAFGVQAGNTETQKIDLSRVTDEKLAPGLYRISKTFKVEGPRNGTSYTAYETFYIYE